MKMWGQKLLGSIVYYGMSLIIIAAIYFALQFLLGLVEASPHFGR